MALIWKCDGCGKTAETFFATYHRHYAMFTSNPFQHGDPVPPAGWWHAHLTVNEQSLAKAFVACCGTCMDKVEEDQRVLHARLRPATRLLSTGKPGAPPERSPLSWRQQEGD